MNDKEKETNATVSENPSDAVSPTVVVILVVDSQETASDHGEGSTESVRFSGVK